MMTTTVSKLKKFFDEEFNSELKNVLITCDQQGRYTVFGEYSIVPTNDEYFRVKSNNLDLKFCTIRNALAYVTLFHAGKYKEARRIQQLDLSLSSINVDLAAERNVLI